MTHGRVFQLNCSEGGVPKLPRRRAALTLTGLVGDKQRELHVHGGPERALCLYSLECILALQNEGHPVFPGSTGENLTIIGVEWSLIKPGDIFAIGNEVVIQISSYTAPCRTIAASFLHGRFMRISQKKYPGWSRLYARVIKTGFLQTGQPVIQLHQSP